MGNFFELIQKRESCRNYDGRPVDKALLTRMVEAARLAPSACNSQPWHFTVFTGEKAREVAKCTQKMGFNGFTDMVPAFIVISETHATLSQRIAGTLSDQHFAPIDIGIVTAHLCLAATSLGLSTCIIGWFFEDKLRGLLPEKAGERIRLVLAVGYAQTEELRTKKRKELENIVTFAD